MLGRPLARRHGHRDEAAIGGDGDRGDLAVDLDPARLGRLGRLGAEIHAVEAGIGEVLINDVGIEAAPFERFADRVGGVLRRERRQSLECAAAPRQVYSSSPSPRYKV